MFSLRIVILIIILFVASSILAQEGATATYTSSDGTFTFQYPADWEMMDTPGGVHLNNLPWDERSTSPLSFNISVTLPTDSSYHSMMGWGTTPAEMVRAQAQFTGFAGVLFSTQFEDFEDGELEGMEEALQRVEEVVITEYTINGYPAARALFSTEGAFGYTTSQYLIVLEVGNDKVIWVYGISFNGETPLLQNEGAFLAIAESIRYVPLPVTPSGNPNLPQTYSGPVGVWDMGTLTFNYPDNWYVLPLGPFLQNTPERIEQANLLPGQLQVGITGPDGTMLLFEEMNAILECRINTEAITAESVLDATMPVSPEQIEAVQEAGITYDEPERVDLDGLVVYRMRITDPKRDIMVLTADMGNSYVILVMAFAPLGEMSRHEATLLDIVSTFEFAPNPERCLHLNENQ